MSRLYIEYVTAKDTRDINDYLALPQQYDVVAVQHVVDMEDRSATIYMLTRKSG